MPEDRAAKPRTWRDRTIQFLFGAVLGLVFSLIPLYFVWMSATAVNSTQAIVIAGFTLFCGIASAIWGKQFLSRLMDLLDSAPPI